jgi:bis(5'-adenosyl)-triphosphatase
VHFHILPRRFHDDPFAGKNDEIYSAVDSAERELAQGLQSESVGFRVDADEKPKERTLQEMVKEADWLKSFFETDAQ